METQGPNLSFSIFCPVVVNASRIGSFSVPNKSQDLGVHVSYVNTRSLFFFNKQYPGLSTNHILRLIYERVGIRRRIIVDSPNLGIDPGVIHLGI